MPPAHSERLRKQPPDRKQTGSEGGTHSLLRGGPMNFIDSPADYLAARERMAPVYVTSKTNGKVLVPCCNTFLVRPSLVVANGYNPNSVPPDKMALLRESILDNGFCFPIVTIWDDDLEKFVVIDGFHRRVIGGGEWLDLDYLPIVVLQHDISKRMAATVQFNKSLGIHQNDLNAEIVRTLLVQVLTEWVVAMKLGKDLDTVHRYKQLTGVAEIFKNADYSMAWEIVEEADE